MSEYRFVAYGPPFEKTSAQVELSEHLKWFEVDENLTAFLDGFSISPMSGACLVKEDCGAISVAVLQDISRLSENYQPKGLRILDATHWMPLPK